MKAHDSLSPLNFFFFLLFFKGVLVVSLGLSGLFRGAAYNGRLVAQQVLGDFPVPSLALSWRMFPDQALSRIRWGTFHVLLSLLGTLCPWQLGKVVRRTSLLSLLLSLLLFFSSRSSHFFFVLIHPMSSELWLWLWLILMIPTIFPFALPISTRVALGYYFYFYFIFLHRRRKKR